MIKAYRRLNIIKYIYQDLEKLLAYGIVELKEINTVFSYKNLFLLQNQS
ncbi:hypothetical protein EV06_0678 [Prochlorococcus sp. MIT 0602]|nr:hypothetical protein EV06_0678 [Prochlorococcus sp. MIT 0602]KGG18192.1 hypothetical protein EV07_0106 [Prochlorococcus sp. MIT 0603]